jgi:hypothetical protein
MKGTLIRTLAAVALSIAASSATAQSSIHSMEYRWLTLFGEIEHSLPALQNGRMPQRNALESVLSRSFLTLESDYRLEESVLAGGHFRLPDPEFGKPAAFRRPRQARLSFSIRF